MYILATIGMVRLVFFSGQTTVRRWEITIPVLGVIVLGYTVFRNVWPLPAGVAWWGPSVAIAWFVIGIIWVLAQARCHAPRWRDADAGRRPGPAAGDAGGAVPVAGEAAT